MNFSTKPTWGSVEEEEKENGGNGSNGTHTNVEKKVSKKTVTWAVIARRNGDKRKILAKITE